MHNTYLLKSNISGKSIKQLNILPLPLFNIIINVLGNEYKIGTPYILFYEYSDGKNNVLFDGKTVDKKSFNKSFNNNMNFVNNNINMMNNNFNNGMNFMNNNFH